MPVDIKTEEIIKNITKSLAEVYKSYSESIGDENTANTSIFELNNLRSIAEDGIPYFGVIETNPLSFQFSYSSLDPQYVSLTSGQIGYKGQILTINSQKIGLKKSFSTSFSASHVYGIVLGISQSELDKTSQQLFSSVTEQANIGSTQIKVKDISVASNLGFPLQAYIGSVFVEFTGINGEYLTISSALSQAIQLGTPVSFLYQTKINAISGPAVTTVSLNPVDFTYFPIIPKTYIEIGRILVQNPQSPYLTNVSQCLRTAVDYPQLTSANPLLGNDTDRGRILSACTNAIQELDNVSPSSVINSVIQSLISYTNKKITSSSITSTFKKFWSEQPFRATNLYGIGSNFSGIERFEFDDNFKKAYYEITNNDLIHTFAIFRGDLFDSTRSIITNSNVTGLTSNTNNSSVYDSSLGTGSYVYGVSAVTNAGETNTTSTSIICKSNTVSYFINELTWNTATNAVFYHVYKRSSSNSVNVDSRLSNPYEIVGIPQFTNTQISPTTNYLLTSQYIALKFIPANSNAGSSSTLYCGGVDLNFWRSGASIINSTDGFEVYICSDNSGNPNRSSKLSSTTRMQYRDFPTASAITTIAFESGANLTKNSTYWIVLEYNAVSNPINVFRLASVSTGTNLTKTSSDGNTWSAVSGNEIYFKPKGYLDYGRITMSSVNKGIKLTKQISNKASRLSVYIPPVDTLETISDPKYDLTGKLVSSASTNTNISNDLIVTVIAKNGENGIPKTLTTTVTKNTPRNTRILLGTTADLFDRVEDVYVYPGNNLTTFSNGLVDWSIYDLITIETVP
jgi:hypothetical protein